MDSLLKPARTAAFVFAAACLLVWALVPAMQPVAAGCLLGVAASAVNALLLRRRMDWLANQAAAGRTGRMGVGMASRLATVLLAAMIAFRYEHIFSMPATIAACFYVQVSLFVIMIVHNKRQSSRKG